MTKLTELPVWMLLGPASQDALLLGRGDTLPAAIAIARDLGGDAVANVPLMATTRLMLARARALGGLALTATGALSRADVRAIFDAIDWPGYDKAHVLMMNKALNEADVMPVELTRLTAQTVKLLRKREKRLLATKAGQALAQEGQAVEVFRQLFTTVFWRLNLSYFDRVPLEAWPQDHIGIVLWCLSVAGKEWFRAEDLMRTCSVWDPALDEGPADLPVYAFEGRVLRPLTWFGLLEMRLAGDEGTPEWRRDRRYRKAGLYDRVLRFDVQVIKPEGHAH